MSKGGTFEREVCKELSLWYSRGGDDNVFYRTAGSGGRATARRRSGKRAENQAGDVGAVAEQGQSLIRLVHFEIKRGYNKVDLQDLLDRGPGRPGDPGRNWHDWIRKAEGEALETGASCFVLIVRRDQRRAVILGPGEVLSAEGADHVALSHDGRRLVAMRLSDFLRLTDPDEFETRAELAGGKR